MAILPTVAGIGRGVRAVSPRVHPAPVPTSRSCDAMSVYLYRLARWCSAWRWAVKGTRLVAVLAAVVIAQASGGKTSNTFSVPGTESQQVVSVLQQQLPTASGGSTQVVFAVQNGSITDAAETAPSTPRAHAPAEAAAGRRRVQPFQAKSISRTARSRSPPSPTTSRPPTWTRAPSTTDREPCSSPPRNTRACRGVDRSRRRRLPTSQRAGSEPPRPSACSSPCRRADHQPSAPCSPPAGMPIAHRPRSA